MSRSANLYARHRREHASCCSSGAATRRPRPWAIRRADGQPSLLLAHRDRASSRVYVCPDLNYGAAVHADKWIPILPNTDAALQLAIAYVWITEGTYDKEYVATHTYGFDKFEDYVLGKEDGVPKTPAWASEKCGVPGWTIKALASDWANKDHQPHPRQRRPRHPRPLLHRAGPAGGHAPGHAGPGQARRPSGEDDRVVALAACWYPLPYARARSAATAQRR